MPLGIITLEDVLEELIGEEIYDEFDMQGAHGDPYEVPPVHHPQDHDKDHSKGSKIPYASQSGRPASDNQQPSHHFHSHLTAQLPTLLKGLVRTRSAPPIPRENAEEGDHHRVMEGEKVTHFADDLNQGGAPQMAAAIQMPKPIKSLGRPPPSAIIGQQSSISSDSGVSAALAPSGPIEVALPMLAGSGKSGTAPVQTLDANIPPILLAASPSIGAAANPAAPAAALHNRERPSGASASPSPAPALEAILLDRKRRLVAASVSSVAGTGGGVSASPSPAPTTTSVSVSESKDGVVPVPTKSGHVHGASAKGTRFKSSPLGGVERQQGLVVAEQVKVEAAGLSKEGGTEEGVGEGEKS